MGRSLQCTSLARIAAALLLALAVFVSAVAVVDCYENFGLAPPKVRWFWAPLLAAPLLLWGSPRPELRAERRVFLHAAACGVLTSLIVALWSGLAVVGERAYSEFGSFLAARAEWMIVPVLALGAIAAALSLLEHRARSAGWGAWRVGLGGVLLVGLLCFLAMLQQGHLLRALKLGISSQAALETARVLGRSLRLEGVTNIYLRTGTLAGSVLPALLIARHRGLTLLPAWSGHAGVAILACLGIASAPVSLFLFSNDFVIPGLGAALALPPVFYLADYLARVGDALEATSIAEDGSPRLLDGGRIEAG